MFSRTAGFSLIVVSVFLCFLVGISSDRAGEAQGVAGGTNVIVFDDFDTADVEAAYEPIGDSDLFFDETNSRLIVRTRTSGGLLIRLRDVVTGFEDIVCHRFRLELFDAGTCGPLDLGDGGGGGGSLSTLTWEFDAALESEYESDPDSATEYTLLESEWLDSGSGIDYTTTKNSPSGSSVDTTTESTSGSLSTSTTLDPQMDRITNSDGEEEIEFKYVVEGSTVELYPLSDPPPTVTTGIKLLTNGTGCIALDWVVLEGDHTQTIPPAQVGTTRGLWVLVVLLMITGGVVAARRRVRPASA